jgi:hypothetical protein
MTHGPALVDRPHGREFRTRSQSRRHQTPDACAHLAAAPSESHAPYRRDCDTDRHFYGRTILARHKP